MSKKSRGLTYGASRGICAHVPHAPGWFRRSGVFSSWRASLWQIAGVITLVTFLFWMDAFYQLSLLSARGYSCARHVLDLNPLTTFPTAGGPAETIGPPRCINDCEDGHTMDSVFDEVLVLTMPWRAQWNRTLQQVTANELRVTKFYGVDMRDPELARHHLAMRCDSDTGLSLGELAFSLSWIAMLKHIQQLPPDVERVLILEDDIILARHFKETFNASVHGIPADWEILFLGASQHDTWETEKHVRWPYEKFNAPYYVPLFTSGTYAVGLHRRVVPWLLDRIARLDCAVDTCAITEYLRTCERCFTVFPNIIIADVRSSSLRSGQDMSQYAAHCHWDLSMFDIPSLPGKP
jgi:GR25 family glycosyltransferase involved in LPS biosynthesis